MKKNALLFAIGYAMVWFLAGFAIQAATMLT
jgi:hypothetical protein